MLVSVFFLTRPHASYFFFFFFQAEDGIRDFHVTGVQTCALPISPGTDTGHEGQAPCRCARDHADESGSRVTSGSTDAVGALALGPCSRTHSATSSAVSAGLPSAGMSTGTIVLRYTAKAIWSSIARWRHGGRAASLARRAWSVQSRTAK